MIRLSRIADYGIVVMTHLARHADRHVSATEIATATGLPVPMTSKVLKALTRAGLVGSHRGIRGGYGLARPAGAITVAAIIEALDGPIAITSCVDTAEHGCDIQRLCGAKVGWQRINDAIRGALGGITLDEMAHAIPTAFQRPSAGGQTPSAGAARPQPQLSGGV